MNYLVTGGTGFLGSHIVKRLLEDDNNVTVVTTSIRDKTSIDMLDINKNRMELYSLRKSLLNLNFQKITGQLEKTSEIKKTKR